MLDSVLCSTSNIRNEVPIKSHMPDNQWPQAEGSGDRRL